MKPKHTGLFGAIEKGVKQLANALKNQRRADANAALEISEEGSDDPKAHLDIVRVALEAELLGPDAETAIEQELDTIEVIAWQSRALWLLEELRLERREPERCKAEIRACMEAGSLAYTDIGSSIGELGKID